MIHALANLRTKLKAPSCLLYAVMFLFATHAQAGERTAVTKQEAQVWNQYGFSAADAGEWKHGGFSPAEANLWVQAGIEFPQWADQWQGEGFGPEQAKESKETGLYVTMGIAASSHAQSPAAKGADMKPLIIGHRGAAGLAPENTLAAFAKACELGIDGIELDVLVSADGELVVHHDFRLKPEIARTADGKWISSASPPALKDLTVAQLKTYDVGRLQPKTSYTGRYPEQTPIDGERIPKFKEVIQFLKRSCNPSTRLFVEVKTSPEEPALTPRPEEVSDQVVKMLREEGIMERTWILSFDWRNLVHIQKIAPELVTVYLTISVPGSDTLRSNQPGPSPWMAGFDIDDFDGSAPRAVKAAGGRVWSPFFRNLTPEALEEARRLGLGVSVWTPDRPEDLKQMIEMKVDAITTNRPDVMKKLLKE